MEDEAVQRVFVAEGAPDTAPTPVRIVELSAGFMVSKALFVAAEVGLFGAIDADGSTPEAIGDRCGIPARSARALADLLTAAGLLEQDGARYRNAPDAEAFLAGRGPLDLRPLLRYWDLVSYPTWANAATAFRTRQGVRGELNEAQTEAYESGVALVTAETAADLAREFDFGPHRRVLDVGGGLGTFVKPILARYEHLRATVVDLPEVAAAVRREGAFADRLEAVGADLFADPLPGGHDLILVANVLHLFPPERNIELLRRLRDVVPADGRLLLVDWWREGAAPHPSARFGAGEFLMISGGDLYQPDEAAEWLAATGWRDTGLLRLSPPSSVVVAEPAG